MHYKMEEQQYQWNNFGVCLNPTTAREYVAKGGGMGSYVEVKVAQKPTGEWCYGTSWAYGNGGGGVPVSAGYKCDEVYPTRHKAEMAGIDQLLRIFRNISGQQDIINKLLEWRQGNQLSLFD